MTIREPARDIPVIEDVDICVVGGSCTGVFAAVKAARLGASVAIIEKQNCFGGVATAGLVNVWHSFYDERQERRIIAGLSDEVVQRLDRRGAVSQSIHRTNSFRLNTEELKIELDELVEENSIAPFLHSFYAAPYVEGEDLKAVVIENKTGRAAIRARIFIDATGDADLALDLGCPSYAPETLQPPTTCSKIMGIGTLSGWDWQAAIQEHGHEYNLPDDWGWRGAIPGLGDIVMSADTHVFSRDTSDSDDLTRAEIEGRRQIRAMMDIVRKYGPSHGKVDLVDLAATIGARETKRIECAYRLTGDDVLNGIRFHDAIANGSYRVDIHHSDGPGITFRYLDGTEVVIPGRNRQAERGRWREPTDQDPTFYQIPYRSLIQKRYANLLLAGRMLDADKVAFSAARVMVNMNQTGEAAGTAAYLALDGDTSVQELSPKTLRKTMADGGSIII